MVVGLRSRVLGDSVHWRNASVEVGEAARNSVAREQLASNQLPVGFRNVSEKGRLCMLLLLLFS